MLWAGVDDVERGLAAVAEVVEGVGERLGFAREQRPFTGHVTVGRVEGARRVDARAALDAFARDRDVRRDDRRRGARLREPPGWRGLDATFCGHGPRLHSN